MRSICFCGVCKWQQDLAHPLGVLRGWANHQPSRLSLGAGTQCPSILALLRTGYMSVLNKQAAGSLAVHGLLSALTSAATRAPRARPGAPPADPGAALAAAAALLNLLREPAAAQRLLDGRDRVAALIAGVQVGRASIELRIMIN